MKIFILVLAMVVGIFYAMPTSWAVDPNINTQSTDLRSNGSDGSPGFNPCLGGTRDTDGVCGGAVSASALLSPANLTLFTTLGPGAVTDNMFGIIEQPASPGSCGAQGSAGVNDVGTNKLNCGDVRFDPGTQGQTGLTGDNDLMTTAPVNMNNSLSADFCANAATDCLDSLSVQKEAAHVGFDFRNNFSWNRVDNTTASVVSSQRMEQVTALKTTGIGTFAVPGTGDQRVLIITDFDTTPGGSSNNPLLLGTALVTWSQTIEDPDQSGVGSGKFSQSIAGSFIYGGSLFPSVQYPDGQSQTNGDTSATLP